MNAERRIVGGVFTVVLTLFLFNTAFAQRDTAVYYLKEPQKLVSTKDSADFFLVILPPDTAVNKHLFIVKEYYRSGKIRLAATSRSNRISALLFQGTYVAFYPNGRRKLIRMYDKGKITGEELEYYPNGKLYHIRTYSKNNEPFLKQYNDSTGSVLAENGKGKWMEYDESFTGISAEGDVDKGMPIGNWDGALNDSTSFVSVFDKGKLLSTSTIHRYQIDKDVFTNVDSVPEFPGGMGAFIAFLSKNVRFPAEARENNIHGIVIISLVIEKNGDVSNVRVVRGIGGGCDEEAARVIRSSPQWKPGKQDGKPVRVLYNVPISFTLVDELPEKKSKDH